MKYKIFLVLIFFTVFGSEKKVVALQFLFYSVISKNLLKTKKTQEEILEILNEAKKEAKKEIKYKIIFDDGSFEEKILKGHFASLINEANTKEILENILHIFDEKSNKKIDKEIKDEDREVKDTIKKAYIEENNEQWKNNYIEENKEFWKREYQENLKKEDSLEKQTSESVLNKKTWKKRLKDSGLFFLGAGLGFVIDRYVLKK